MSWIFGNATIDFNYAADSIQLPTKDGNSISLASICESVTPPCRLNPLLFNGHLQTAWTISKGLDVPIHYRRKIFEAEDARFAGTFAVDFVSRDMTIPGDLELPPRTSFFSELELKLLEGGSEDKKPMLVTLHGLSGGSHELYLRHVLDALVKLSTNSADGTKSNCWEACVINSRGCARSKITSQVLYNARATWDIRQIVKWLRNKYPNRPLFGIGYSLGANILTNYLGEEGSKCELKAAIVLSNPWNLEAGSLALQRTYLGLEVYSKAMGGNMKKLFERHVDQISKNPKIDVEKIRQTKYLHEFDRELQGPTWGYPTEGAYYRDASSTDSLLAVRIPLFAIHADDDPIVAREAVPFMEVKQNPHAVLCTTSLGGHLSWFETGGSRWFVKPIVGFLRKLVEDMDIDKFPRSEKDAVWTASGVENQIFEPMRRKLHIPS